MADSPTDQVCPHNVSKEVWVDALWQNAKQVSGEHVVGWFDAKTSRATDSWPQQEDYKEWSELAENRSEGDLEKLQVDVIVCDVFFFFADDALESFDFCRARFLPCLSRVKLVFVPISHFCVNWFFFVVGIEFSEERFQGGSLLSKRRSIRRSIEKCQDKSLY